MSADSSTPLPQISGWSNDSKRNQENSMSLTYDLTNIKQILRILAALSPSSVGAEWQ